MAVTLSVDLTDAEQAKLVEIANLIQPGATQAQIKAWAEKTCKRELRKAVRERYMATLDEAASASLSTWDSAWAQEA